MRTRIRNLRQCQICSCDQVCPAKRGIMFSVTLHALTWWSIHPEHTSIDSYESTSSWTFQQCLTQSTTRLFCPSSWISWHSTAMFIVITGDMEGIHICSMQTPTMLSAWSSSVLPLYPLSWWGHILPWVFIPLLRWWHGWQLIIWDLIPSKLSCSTSPEFHPHVKIFVIFLDNSQNSLSDTAGNLVVTTDNQLSFSPHIAKMTCSCWLVLYNIGKNRAIYINRSLFSLFSFWVWITETHI